MTPDEAGPPGSLGYERELLFAKLEKSIADLRAQGLIGRFLAWRLDRLLQAARQRAEHYNRVVLPQLLGLVRDRLGAEVGHPPRPWVN
jgi:hypothetical protein